MLGGMESDGNPVAAVRAARQRLVELAPDQERADGDFHLVSLPTRDCDALRDLLLAEQARVVIEIGLAYGSAALAIAEALADAQTSDARHLIIDPYQHQFRNVGWQSIVDAGVDTLCTLVEERSQLALPKLAPDHLVADAAFVDGSHVFHNVFVDLYFLREIVRPGGLIVLDDCQWPSVATAVRYFELNAGWQRQPIEGSERLQAYRLPDPRTEPSFDAFKPFGDQATS